jgi:hypothetical protein
VGARNGPKAVSFITQPAGQPRPTKLAQVGGSDEPSMLSARSSRPATVGDMIRWLLRREAVVVSMQSPEKRPLTA